jgi:Uma2 family endonuclease
MQINLLIHLLKQSGLEQGCNDAYVNGDAFVYYSVEQARHVAETVERGDKLEFRGPDVFWVKGVGDLRMRDYWVAWEEGGRLPDLIVELYSKSNTKRHREEKKALYSQVWRTSEYFLVQGPKGRGLEGFRLAGREYRPIRPNPRGWLWSEQIGCFFGTWTGAIEGQDADWIRLYRPDGTLVPTFEERVEKERQRAQAEHQRAEAEHQRAEAERQRAEAAEAELARLRALLEERGGS